MHRFDAIKTGPVPTAGPLSETVRRLVLVNAPGSLDNEFSYLLNSRSACPYLIPSVVLFAFLSLLHSLHVRCSSTARN